MSRRCIRSSGLYRKLIACPTGLALACRSFDLCQWAHSSKSCSRRPCSRCGYESEGVLVWKACAHHLSKERVKSQKSLGRPRELRLQIFGSSYLQGRDLSLKKIQHAFKGRVIENRGEFTFREIRFDGRLSPCV